MTTEVTSVSSVSCGGNSTTSGSDYVSLVLLITCSSVQTPVSEKVKVKEFRTPKERRQGAHVSFIGR